MPAQSKMIAAAIGKVVPKPVLVGYKIFTEAMELVEDYRVKDDKLYGHIVRELDALLQIDDSASEGSDYLYFSLHGLKGASFAWNKAGNAIVFKIKSADANGNGMSYVGRTYYLVTMSPIVIRPSEAIEILAHARSGKDNDKFFSALANDINETTRRLQRMVHPSRRVHLTP
jgi:hypothetical protein